MSRLSAIGEFFVQTNGAVFFFVNHLVASNAVSLYEFGAVNKAVARCVAANRSDDFYAGCVARRDWYDSYNITRFVFKCRKDLLCERVFIGQTLGYHYFNCQNPNFAHIRIETQKLRALDLYGLHSAAMYTQDGPASFQLACFVFFVHDVKQVDFYLYMEFDSLLEQYLHLPWQSTAPRVSFKSNVKITDQHVKVTFSFNPFPQPFHKVVYNKHHLAFLYESFVNKIAALKNEP